MTKFGELTFGEPTGHRWIWWIRRDHAAPVSTAMCVVAGKARICRLVICRCIRRFTWAVTVWACLEHVKLTTACHVTVIMASMFHTIDAHIHADKRLNLLAFKEAINASCTTNDVATVHLRYAKKWRVIVPDRCVRPIYPNGINLSWAALS